MFQFSSVAQPCLTLVTLWTVGRKAPLSIGFPRWEYWNGLPFPFPGYLPDSGSKPALQADSLPLSHQGSPSNIIGNLNSSLVVQSGCTIYTSISNLWEFYMLHIFIITHLFYFGNFSEFMLEKAMATHSSTLAWKIPWTGKPGRL